MRGSPEFFRRLIPIAILIVQGHTELTEWRCRVNGQSNHGEKGETGPEDLRRYVEALESGDVSDELLVDLTDSLRQIAESISSTSEPEDLRRYVEALETGDVSDELLVDLTDSLRHIEESISSVGQCHRDVPFADIYLVFLPGGGKEYRCTHDPYHTEPG
jgi:hypothetical protein